MLQLSSVVTRELCFCWSSPFYTFCFYFQKIFVCCPRSFLIPCRDPIMGAQRTLFPGQLSTAVHIRRKPLSFQGKHSHRCMTIILLEQSKILYFIIINRGWKFKMHFRKKQSYTHHIDKGTKNVFLLHVILCNLFKNCKLWIHIFWFFQ